MDRFIRARKSKRNGHSGKSKGYAHFFLTQYCSEINRLETDWHQLQTHEWRGQMFEYELELAYAVIDGVEARAEVRGY